MAKMGPSEKGGYDPFKLISNSLSDLVEAPPPVEPTPPARPPKRMPPAKPVQREVVTEEVAAVERVEPPEAKSDRLAEIPAPKPHPRSVSAASALQITKRMKTTRRDAAQFDAAAMQLGAVLGVSVDFSKVTRALWEIYLRHQDDILRNVPEGEVWERPANYDAAALAELDERIANLINDGLMIACRRPKNTK